MASSGVSWTLPDHPKLPKGKTAAVVVLDGWGEANPDEYNCIHVAQTPVMDSLKNGAPERWRLVKAHGTAVGLPSDDDMGNSEVGHNALGAGRIFAQGAKLVDSALASGKIYDGEGFNYIKESFDNGTLHLIGLLSDGGVHSRLDQVQLLLKGASERGAKRIRVHILTDGRDVLDGSSVGFVETLENDLQQLRDKGVDARIASGGGRMYVTMDRNEVDSFWCSQPYFFLFVTVAYQNDWGVVKRGWDAQVLGEAPYKFKSAVEAVKTLIRYAVEKIFNPRIRSAQPKKPSPSFRLRNGSLNALRLRRVFDRFDRNGDGKITLDEMASALEALGLNADRAGLEAAGRGHIPAGDAGLRFEDFELLHRALGEEVDDEGDMKEAFRVFDEDGDGFISAAELQAVLKKLDLPEAVQEMICNVDSDRDGRVDFGEFKNMMQGMTVWGA